MEEGNLHELAVIERLRNEGWIISRQQEELEYVLAGFNVLIQTHPDGVIQFNRGDGSTDPPLLLEIKSMGDSSFKDFKRRGWSNPGLIQKYKWQVSVGMHLLSMPLMFVVKNRNSGEIDTDLVKLPFYSWPEIVARITKIEVAARNSDLPELCDWKMYPCPFNYLHEEDTSNTEIGGEELSELVAEYVRKRDERDRVTAECKVILGEIKEKAGGKKIELPFATFNEVSTRKVSYDYDKMRENGIDVDAYEKVNFISVPRVTKKKVKDGETGKEKVSPVVEGQESNS